MLLKNKTAIIYGAAGAVGSAVARSFARDGARVFLTSRASSLGRLRDLAAAIKADGGAAESADVDALDEKAVEAHAADVAHRAGRIDISFNAIGIPQLGIQGLPITDLAVESFMQPIQTYARSHFITARSAARRMVAQKSGVILMHTPEPARAGAPLVGGMGPAWAAMEAFMRDVSAEFGAHGVRAVCLRTTALLETDTIATVFGLHARAIGISREQFQAMMEGMSHHRRCTTMREFTDAAVLAASDRGGGLLGTVVNLTAGKSAD
jgi:NAD(P)-dependent dehydrogenase (short-subunit alcohol dehydrogenase family)